jgi:hypothetical protein
MKLLLKTAFLLSALLGCTNPSSPDESSDVANQQEGNDKVEEIALRQIFDKIRKFPNTKFTGKQIIIGDSSISLKVTTEFNGQKEGSWIYAAAFSTLCHFGKDEKITIGSLGIGSSAREAQDICIQEWFATFGTAFDNMLQDSGKIVLSDKKVFPGLMGIRGNLPENTWLRGDDNMTKTIMSKIGSRIHPEPNKMISIAINIMVNNKGSIDGECRLNNQVSEELLSDLKQLNWPASEKGFLFKQFYLVKKIK